MAGYKIVLTGIQFRQDRDAVRDSLAKLFKCNTEKIDSLLGKAPVTVKSNVNMEAAMKYQKAIQDTGAECMVRPQDD